jgi:DNA topoisomerase-3
MHPLLPPTHPAAEFQSWDKTDPATLFDAPTIKAEANPKARVCRHLQAEAKGCDYLVLWLDCDREGENICFGGDGLPPRRLQQRRALRQAGMGQPARASRRVVSPRDPRAVLAPPAEVVDNTVQWMNRVGGQQVFRARFSGGRRPHVRATPLARPT